MKKCFQFSLTSKNDYQHLLCFGVDSVSFQQSQSKTMKDGRERHLFREVVLLSLTLFLLTYQCSAQQLSKTSSCSFKIVPVYSGSGDDLEGGETYNFNTRFVFPHPHHLVLIQTISSSLFCVSCSSIAEKSKSTSN